MSFKKIATAAIVVFSLLIGLITLICSITTVNTGSVGVVSLYGNVLQEGLKPGLHFIHPLKVVTEIECKQDAYTVTDMQVPSQDQLTTTFDLTVKFNIDQSKAVQLYSETGNKERAIEKHLIPQIRSTFREEGNQIEKAEHFFLSDTKEKMQNSTLLTLKQKLEPKGFIIEDILIRKVNLPKSVRNGVEAKVLQKQEAEREEEKLNQFKTEQKRKVALAESEAIAAESELKKRKLQAEAEAFEVITNAEAKAKALHIEGEALRKNPEIKELRLIETWDGKLSETVVGETNATIMLPINNKN